MKCKEEISPEIVKKSYLFSDFDHDELSPIVDFTKCNLYEAGEVVFNQGDQAKSLFIIFYGTVGLEVNDYEDYESAPVLLGSEQTFGESHFYLNEKRVGAAKTREKSEIYEIDYRELKDYLEKRPHLELKFARRLSKDLGRHCHFLLEGMMKRKERIQVNSGVSAFI